MTSKNQTESGAGRIRESCHACGGSMIYNGHECHVCKGRGFFMAKPIKRYGKRMRNGRFVIS